MRLLVLGGTAWLGRECAAQAVAAGDEVVCLARGTSGDVAPGSRLVAADRDDPDAYDAVADVEWDAVIDVSRTPRHVRGALDALADRAGHWTFVSTGNVYADTATRGLDETAALLPPGEGDGDDPASYGGAKVAAEQACTEALADRLLVARSGLIGGPGDPSGRAAAWVARAARAPHDPMLVPADHRCPCQVVDVRDLAAWVLLAARTGVVGVMNAVGPTIPLTEWIELSRQTGGHTGEIVCASIDWLTAQGVESFSGPGSLAMWIGDPAWHGFLDRDGSAARRAGLAHRPYREMLADILADEQARGLDRPRRAGLTPAREQELLALLAR